MHYLASTDIRRYLFLLIMGIESIAMQIFNLIILSLYSINFFFTLSFIYWETEFDNW